jgi:hypothetical protein
LHNAWRRHRPATTRHTATWRSKHGRRLPIQRTPTAIRFLGQTRQPPANQGASIQRTGQISGYSSLSAQGQQAIAAQGATVDLGDAANATTLQTIGTVRANAPQREADIKTLEVASHSTDPAQQTELATLQRINQAMLLQLRTQQEASQMTQTQSLQQLVQQKQQQDALKMSMQVADGYEANYNSHVTTDTTGITKALSY